MSIGFFKEDSFAGYDITAPEIKSVRFNKEQLTKPGTFKLEIDVVEEETGVLDWTIFFSDKEGLKQIPSDAVLYLNDPCQPGQGSIHTFSKPMFTGKLILEFSVTSKCPSCDMVPTSIYLRDQQGNETYAYIDDPDISDDYGFSCQNSLSVQDEFDVDFQYHITNPNVLGKIKAMPNGTTGMLNYDNNNHVAKKEWFDAIRGTDKNLVFSNNSTQWLFNGRSITSQTKNVDLMTTMQRESGQLYCNDRDIVKVIFPNNGRLPGTATVRLKSDYIYSLFNLNKTVYLYYISGSTCSLEDTSFRNILDGTDHWCEFSVNHNSTFILSGQKVQLVKGTKFTKLRKLKRGFSIRWKQIKDANGYQIQYSTKKNFRSKKTLKIKTNKTILKKIKKLKLRKKYYVRIRTYKKVGGKTYYSPWSKVKSVKTK